MSQAELWGKIDDSLIRIRDAFDAGETARQADRALISQLLKTQSGLLVTQGKILTQVRFQWIVLVFLIASSRALEWWLAGK